MKKYVLAVLFLVIDCSFAIGQITIHAVQITSPLANEEICVASSVPISATFKNGDNTTRTLIAHFQIYNIVTRNHVYSQTDTLRNVPAGASVDTTFPAYVTNPNILNQLGSFLACAGVTELNNTGWPFADSSCVRIFGIRTTALSFRDPSDNYSKTAAGDIPDQTKWVSLGAKVVEGENETWDPPPPKYMKADGGVGPDTLFAPVIRMDRSDVNGNIYSGSGVGDTLVSFPFNLTAQTRVVLTFDFMRAGKHLYPDLWDAVTMNGPEQTVLGSSGEVIRPGDSLILEFKDTSEPACNPSAGGWKEIVGIDGGQDLEFQSFWIFFNYTSALCKIGGKVLPAIPLDRKYFNNGFRFRLRLKAKNDEKGSTPKDDDDPWYVDNLSLQVPFLPEIEVKWAHVVTPYTKIPFSAAAALPVFVSIRNNFSGYISPPLPIVVEIDDTNGQILYKRTDTITSLAGGADTIIRFPDWNAQNANNNSSAFIVKVSLASASYDDYTPDNHTFSNFFLNVEKGDNAIQEYAYDDAGITPGRGQGNDIPFLTKITGQGVGFSSSSGSYAMKFVLPETDTVYGSRIYFGGGNSAPDGIRISLLQGNPNSCVPGDPVQPAGKTVLEEVRRGGVFDQFWPYYFPQPVVLPAGTYWLAVSQLSLESIMLGGDLSRGGGVIRIASDTAPQISPIYSNPYGTQWSPTQNNGDVSCAFAVEVTAGSGNWLPWAAGSGFWPTNNFGSGNQAYSWNPVVAAPFIRGGSYMPMIRVMVGSLGSIRSGIGGEHPKNFGFEEIYPNPITPSSGSAEFRFILSESGSVSLSIYDGMGREIRKLSLGELEEGIHSGRWDGRDGNGLFVSPGIYFCRLSEGSRSAQGKIIVVR